MFSKKTLSHGLAPAALAVAMACALGACKKQDAAAAQDAASVAQPAPAPTAESVVSATISAMNPDKLREEASKAYGENRLYAPAGNNAMEFYLALRDKLPADAGASSALTDLLPMTVIATEQGIAREDFAEAKRLAALIEKADPQHPALPRLRSSIETSEAAVLKRIEQQKLTAEQEAKRQEEILRKREEDQRRQQELQRQATQQQAAQQQTAAQQAAAEAERQRQAAAEAERQRQAAAEAERQRQAAAEAERQRQQAAPAPRASSELRALSQPGPRYPVTAQRAGASGSVQVEFTVNTDGSVGNARVVSSDGPRQFSRDFEREALAAVKRWRFEPVSEPVTSRRTISFQQ